MAKESTVGYLPGNTPEAQQANLEYQQALLRMQEALDARKNRFFDPELLALAQGFLAPTQTGGWGESLGYGLKNYREAVAQQEKEEREIAQAQLGLAGRGIELERMRQRDRGFAKALGEPEFEPSAAIPGAPSGPLSTTGAPAAKGPLADTPKGLEGFEGIRLGPRNPGVITGRQYMAAARPESSISLAQAMLEASKLERDRLEVRESGIFDKAENVFYPAPKGEQVTRQIYGQTYKVDPSRAMLLDMYEAQKDPRYHNVAETIVSGAKNIPRPGQAPGGRGAPTGAPGQEPSEAKSEEELAQELNYKKERGTLSAKEQSDEAKAWYARGNDASSLLNDIRVIQGIFSPQNKYSKVLSGVFERGDIQSQVGKLLEGGLLGEALKNSAREIATNAGLPPMAVTQFQMAVSRMADLKLKASRIMEGQGTVTEAERRLIAESVINITDTPMTVLAKADYLAARARFEDTRARMLRDFRDDKRDYNDFVRSKDYQKLKKDYEQELEGIVERRLGIKMPSREQAGRDNESARNRLPASVR